MSRRHERITELIKWAKTQDTAGLKSALIKKSKQLWQVSQDTSEDYAATVLLSLEQENCIAETV